jgi:hypothetical protein
MTPTKADAWIGTFGLPASEWRGRSRNGRPLLAIAVALVAGAVSGCDDVQDDVAADPAALTFGGTTRVMKATCGKRCSKYLGWGGDFHALKCVEYVTDCVFAPPPSVTLHADAAAASTGVVFSAWRQPDWEYWGCGPQAAQNILNYYGVQMRVQDIAQQYIPTFSLIAGSNGHDIGTFPDTLASGLQRLLTDKLGNHFVVQRRSGVTVPLEIDAAIKRGTPIIVLVNGGNHYQTVTGYNQSEAFVIDYPGNDQWRSKFGLDTELSWYSAIFSTVSIGAGGFESNTVITIDYVP